MGAASSSGPRAAIAPSTSRSIPAWAARACVGTRWMTWARPSTRPRSKGATRTSTPPSATMARQSCSSSGSWQPWPACRAGESVSYNASWVAPRDTVVATLRIGYADGIRRDVGVKGQGQVLLRGKRCPIVGVVQMDMTLVDTGPLEVQVGDVATFVGEEAKQRITLEEIAGWSGEVTHEFLTGLGARLPRV